jgi:hypothetical protein
VNRWLAHLRGLLVAVHLVAITLMALPAPEGGMNRASWQDPTVQGELTTWTKRFRSCGLDVTQPQLEDSLWRSAVDYMHWRHQVLAPFQPYYDYCGTRQSWRMFVAPHRYPTRLQIEVEEQGQWRPAYIERDPEHAWLGSVLDHHRFRSVVFRFGWPEYDGDYQQFVRWVAERAAHDFPAAYQMRVRFFKYRTASPEEVRAGQRPEGQFVHEQVRRLEDFR